MSCSTRPVTSGPRAFSTVPFVDRWRYDCFHTGGQRLWRATVIPVLSESCLATSNSGLLSRRESLPEPGWFCLQWKSSSVTNAERQSSKCHTNNQRHIDSNFMKYPPPAQLPSGGTPAQRLDLAFRKVLTVSKDELLKEESKLQQQREKRRAKKKR